MQPHLFFFVSYSYWLTMFYLCFQNNANPNLPDADNMSCLQLARLAAAQIATSPAHRTCHLQVTCPIHHAPNHVVPNSNQTKQNYASSPSQATTCICTLLNMLSPLNSANSLIDLLIALQNNSIANTISNQNNAIANAQLNTSQNTLFAGGNDSHGSGTSLNSNNSAITGFIIPNNSNNTLGRQNNINMGNGRCQPPVGGSIV